MFVRAESFPINVNIHRFVRNVGGRMTYYDKHCRGRGVLNQICTSFKIHRLYFAGMLHIDGI